MVVLRDEADLDAPFSALSATKPTLNTGPSGRHEVRVRIMHVVKMRRR